MLELENFVRCTQHLIDDIKSHLKRDFKDLSIKQLKQYALIIEAEMLFKMDTKDKDYKRKSKYVHANLYVFRHPNSLKNAAKIQGVKNTIIDMAPAEKKEHVSELLTLLQKLHEQIEITSPDQRNNRPLDVLRRAVGIKF